MLLAKIRDKLFNRRNTVEVESLDVPSGTIQDTLGLDTQGNLVKGSGGGGGGHTDDEIKALAKDEIENASSGTIQDTLGLDAQGNLVKDAVSIPTDNEIKALAKDEIENASSGTIQDTLGLDAQGNLVKGSGGGGGGSGTQLYSHSVSLESGAVTVTIISTRSTPYASVADMANDLFISGKRGNGKRIACIEYYSATNKIEIASIKIASGIVAYEYVTIQSGIDSDTVTPL